MKTREGLFAALLACTLALCPAWATSALAEGGASGDSAGITTYRLYNRYTGEHFYTQDAHERDSLDRIGWDYEGVGWTAPSEGDPVYRLYNRYAKGGDHHYTTSVAERDALTREGWTYEGVGWYSDTAKGAPLWRQYNPYASTGTHNFTLDVGENLNLVSHGWRHEGVAWYALDLGPVAPEGDFSGWSKVDGEWFYGYGDGTHAVGWTTVEGNRLHFDGKGRLDTGLSFIDGRYYLFGSDGTPAGGWSKLSGFRYYFNPSTGELNRSGWFTDGGKTYYLDKTSGAMATGLKTIDGSTYFFNADGSFAKGWMDIGGLRYYFASSGKMYKGGWLDSGGKTYYLDKSSGAMVTGQRTIDGTIYLFNDDGSLNKTAGLTTMINKAQGYYSATRWLIMVDTSNNYLGIFTGGRGNWNLQSYWLCTTGKPSTPTVLGEYTVTGKGYSFNGALSLPAYTCYYYTQFYGDYLIHSVEYYQNTFDVLDGRLGQNLSHGCVRLPIEQAKWIYDNIPYGTKFVSYR